MPQRITLLSPHVHAGRAYAPGATLTLDDDAAAWLIRAGVAVEKPAVEAEPPAAEALPPAAEARPPAAEASVAGKVSPTQPRKGVSQ